MTTRWLRCLILCCACTLWFSPGCRTAAVAQRNQVEALASKTTPDGRLVFFEWDAAEGAGHRSRALEGDYGMMIFYDAPSPPTQRPASYKSPLPRYELYIQKDQKIIRTLSLELFKGEIAKIPAGEQLRFYNTCAGGTHWGLAPAILTEVRNCCKKNRVELLESEVGCSICTCP